MASKVPVPQVSDETTDRALGALDQAVSSLISNPMSNGNLVTLDMKSEGPVRVPHGLGRRANGVIAVGADRGCYVATMSKSDDKAATVSLVSQWEVMERKDVSVAASTCDFGAVSGDQDYEYRIEGYWKHGTSTPSLYWYVNGVNSNTLSACQSKWTVAGAAGASGTGLRLAVSDTTSNEEHRVACDFLAVTGQNRLTNGTSNSTYASSAAATKLQHISGKWEDTSTKVVGLGVIATGTTQISAGSFFILSRRPRLKGRKLTLWMF